MATTKKVLVIEDIPATLEATVLSITLRGHTVVEVASVDEALKVLSNDTFDLVLLDWRLPMTEGDSVDAEGGAQLVAAFHRQDGDGIPYVIVSAQMATVPTSLRRDPLCRGIVGKLSLTILDPIVSQIIG